MKVDVRITISPKTGTNVPLVLEGRKFKNSFKEKQNKWVAKFSKVPVSKDGKLDYGLLMKGEGNELVTILVEAKSNKKYVTHRIKQRLDQQFTVIDGVVNLAL